MSSATTTRKLTSEEKTVEHPAIDTTAAWTETVLAATITPRTPDDMRVFYSFTAEQNKALDELLANGDVLTALAGDLTITDQTARDLLAALPPDLSPERRAVVRTACQLVGKVHYFWGGKSLKLGWDDRWGTLRQVTAAGSSTSGLSMQPFTLPVPSVQAMTTPAGPPPDTRRVIWSRSSLSMEPIRAAPVSRRPSAALQVALVV